MSLPIPDESIFLDNILRWSIDSASTNSQREAVIRAVATVVNKRPDGLNSFLTDRLPDLWTSHAANVSIPAEQRRKVIGAWTQVSVYLGERDSLMNSHVCRRSHELCSSEDTAFPLPSLIDSLSCSTMRRSAGTLRGL